MNLYDLKPNKGKEVLVKILEELLNDVVNNFDDDEDGYSLLGNDLMEMLDIFGQDDFFGTEGWQHRFGLED